MSAETALVHTTDVFFSGSPSVIIMSLTEEEERAFADFGLKPKDLVMQSFLKVLKERFKMFALEIHPDKNSSPTATQQYQKMQAQYQQLLELYERQAPSGNSTAVPKPGKKPRHNDCSLK